MVHANRILLLVASAVAYAFAFPPHGWWPLALLSVGVLAGLLHGARPMHGLMTGYWWGMIAFGTGLSWLWQLFGPFSLLLWGILAVFPAAFGWLICLAQQRGVTAGWRLAFFTAVAWTGTEFVRCEVMPLKFPWMHLGLALEPWPLVSTVGVYGLGFVCMLTLAAALFRAKAGWVAFGVLMIVQIDTLVVSKRTPGQSQIKVVAVQAEGAATGTYMSLAKEGAADDTELIVWPEYTIPIDVRNVARSELEKVQAFAKERGALLVFGTQTRLEGPKWQNTALTIDGTNVLGEHGKNHTVHFFNDGEHGKTALPVVTPLGRIGTPICFDCDFQDVVRRMTLEGAEFFAVPSMDAASWSERQHIMHSQLFRVRAAENRRSMVVAASSGVSQIIDSHGRAMKSLGALKTGILSGAIERQTDLTFYTRLGWLIPWVALGVLVMWTALLLGFVKRRTRN
ncbi:apolipoprotein N-acyltransferase [Prosthecobacter sp.]|uniref:apolipoprotein N-acyltransferase n=1 Tax=Prosthecobacter sp. TaxID=1965333 RepID=UPI00378337FB